MPGVQRLGYIGLEVSDIASWIGFATQILGFAAVEHVDGAIDLRMDDHATRIRLMPGKRDDLAYAGWEMRDAAALDALASRLWSADIACTRLTPAEARDRHAEAAIRFTDPDGNCCEAFYGPLQRTDRPFVSPLGVRFKTGQQGLGHIVLTTKDQVAQERFYTELLGLRVSDYIHTEIVKDRPLSLTFLRCNARHHSLALAQAPLLKRLVHLMVEVQSIDDVGRALDRCMEAGYHISMTLGRHANDQMLSFYPMSPSGFDIEYGWGGLAVEEQSWHVLSHDKISAWGHRFQRPPRA